MGSTALKFATWNIGGGILGESHQSSRESSLDYHVSVLKEHAPDLVCLQEAHDYEGRGESQSDYLARNAGYRYVASFPTSESHLSDDAQFALGILSRFPIKDVVGKKLPNVGLDATGPNGDRWTLADKGYVTAMVDLGDRELGVLNAHCFPLHYFGASPLEARFARVWRMLEEDLIAIRTECPALAAIDLNHEPIQSVLWDAVRPGGGYLTAFENTATTPKSVQQDYILYDPAVRLLTTTVAATKADHSYCQASFLV
ncbi:endonuclease/exonuclease/phosphatase family protein [Amycolatopsis japonica]|uniref:endonuclease/exonuclease/phosphatase family protein n=1 Tax=Amycolatopsis japonica TaxID=208439 RepID=UPI00379E3992